MTNFSGENLNIGACAGGPQGERRDSASNKYQAYPEYKDSGLTGIGMIPDHWHTASLSKLFNIRAGGDLKTEYFSEVQTDEYPYPIYTNANSASAVYGYTKKYNFSPNTITVSGRGYIGFAAFRDHCYDAIIRLLVLSPYGKIYCKFFEYFINEVINFKVESSAIGQLSTDQISPYKVAFPLYNEQITIANFLDHETAKIDTLIEKQQQLIQLLKEKRQAVISHTVTKGLNPNAPMKDSGVEWLGEVPGHWVCKSYRYACQIYRGKFGHRPRNDPAFYDGDYPFIQTGDVAQAGKYITEYKQTLNEKGKAVSQLFPAGTLVMTIAANIGDTAILSFEAYAPDSIVGFKPREDVDLEFLRYSLMAALPALVQTSTQSTQANLNIERVGAVQAAFPTKEEQKEIVKFIDQTLDKFDRIERQAVDGVEILQERRTALISAAVTGKIDVRHFTLEDGQGK